MPIILVILRQSKVAKSWPQAQEERGACPHAQGDQTLARHDERITSLHGRPSLRSTRAPPGALFPRFAGRLPVLRGSKDLMTSATRVYPFLAGGI